MSERGTGESNPKVRPLPAVPGVQQRVRKAHPVPLSLGLLCVGALSAWDAVTCERKGTGPAVVVIFATWAIVFAVSAAWVLANERE